MRPGPRWYRRRYWATRIRPGSRSASVTPSTCWRRSKPAGRGSSPCPGTTAPRGPTMRSAAASATATVLCESVKNCGSPPRAAEPPARRRRRRPIPPRIADRRPQGAGDGRDPQDHHDSEHGRRGPAPELPIPIDHTLLTARREPRISGAPLPPRTRVGDPIARTTPSTLRFVTAADLHPVREIRRSVCLGEMVPGWLRPCTTGRSVSANGKKERVEDQTIELAGGRTVGFADYGSPGATAVLWCHGGPGSRLEPAYLRRVASEAGLRIIGIDRPGYGLSTPQPGRTIAGWVPEALAVADHLGIGPFAAVGISTGGAYALALAALAPERV